MKIPYIKIYTADLLAKTRRLSPQEIGEAVIAACEMAFEGSTDYKPAQANAQAFFNMLNDWTAESKEAIKSQHARAKKGAQARWQKIEVLDGAQAFTKEMPKQSICQCQLGRKDRLRVLRTMDYRQRSGLWRPQVRYS